MRRNHGLIALALLAVAASARAQIDARMLRYPDVSATQIAFVYAGDIWLVPKSGGVAERLSTPKGEEMFPRFSPDGKLIGYSASYDGNMDIYVIPAIGGLPTRLTHHPAPDRMLGWFPDGNSILFATMMTSGKDRFNQLYKVARAGGLPEKLPVPYGEFGVISPDGKTLAYVPISTDFRTWKRYRGGMTPDIWLFDLTSFASRNLTSNPANDSLPMWHGSTIYFLSDRDAHERANIWAHDLKTGTLRQVTTFTDYDVRFPSIGPQDLVFEKGDCLYLMDLASEKVREVKVEVVTDRATLKARAENVSKLVRNAAISPSGKRVVLEARGELFSVPAENGVVLNLTNSSGVAERFPSWSPDGKIIAYFSDRSGEYELTLRPADGPGEEKSITRLGPGFRYRPFWSPDGKWLVFADQAMRINLCESASGKVTTVDKGLYMFQGDLDAFWVSWSADSRWFAYSHDIENRNDVVFLYDTKASKLTQATAGFYAARTPAFDPDGKYLFVLTDRTFKPNYGALDQTWIYANVTNVAVISLRKDVPSPLAPRNDVEGEDKKSETKDEAKKDEPKKDSDKAETTDKAEKKEPPKEVEIDLDGFEQRLVVLPPAAGNYAELYAIAGKVLYRREPRTGADDEKNPILFYDLKEREEKTILADADAFTVSADGKKLLVRKKLELAIIEPKPDQKMEKKLPVSGLEAVIDPAAEWRQIFNDAWRIERDYFYDPGMHGVDWPAMRERYGKLLADAVTRWDVNFIIGELIAELNASHTYRGGGDVEEAPERGVGLLGADYVLDAGHFRFKRILAGAPWDSEARSPLRQPGANVKEGDYLLAVNRAPLDATSDPWAAFQGLAKKTVLLTVNDKPTMAGAREVLVETLESEARLRNLAWIEEKRQLVEKAGGGRVGYVYVPDTGVNGQTELVRQFRAQFTKDGLIIDERFNSGGQIPDRFVELLDRPLYSYWGVRDGLDWQWPPIAHAGPEAMVINGWSGSGGDCFPFFFKKAGRGPLIGMRTWGGLIGMTGVPALVDGGIVTAPTFGIYSTNGTWIIEGHGVDPDVEVVDDPAKMVNGGDPQLERAVQEVMNALAKNPPKRPNKPEYQDRSRH